MGSHHHNSKCRHRTSPRRLRTRICLRKDCGRKYQARRWNQRYCQDAECLRQVRRWQAAQRQAKRRQDKAAKAKDAQAQRARRRRVISLPQPPQPLKDPEVALARCHAAKIFFPFPLCERPGCYESPPQSSHNQAKYCCSSCRQAVRRVLDRERKWLRRGTFQGRRARQQEYQTARERRCRDPGDTTRAMASQTPLA